MRGRFCTDRPFLSLTSRFSPSLPPSLPRSAGHRFSQARPGPEALRADRHRERANPECTCHQLVRKAVKPPGKAAKTQGRAVKPQRSSCFHCLSVFFYMPFSAFPGGFTAFQHLSLHVHCLSALPKTGHTCSQQAPRLVAAGETNARNPRLRSLISLIAFSHLFGRTFSHLFGRAFSHLFGRAFSHLFDCVLSSL